MAHVVLFMRAYNRRETLDPSPRTFFVSGSRSVVYRPDARFGREANRASTALDTRRQRLAPRPTAVAGVRRARTRQAPCSPSVYTPSGAGTGPRGPLSARANPLTGAPRPWSTTSDDRRGQSRRRGAGPQGRAPGRTPRARRTEEELRALPDTGPPRSRGRASSRELRAWRLFGNGGRVAYQPLRVPHRERRARARLRFLPHRSEHVLGLQLHRVPHP